MTVSTEAGRIHKPYLKTSMGSCSYSKMENDQRFQKDLFGEAYDIKLSRICAGESSLGGGSGMGQLG